jgi:hypothetical protein
MVLSFHWERSRAQHRGVSALSLCGADFQSACLWDGPDPTFDRFWRKREKIRKNNAETRMKSLKILDF